MFIVALIEYPPRITTELLSSRRIAAKRSQKLSGRPCLTHADAESAIGAANDRPDLAIWIADIQHRPSRGRDTIELAWDDQPFQGGLQRNDVDIGNAQALSKHVARLIRLEHDVLQPAQPDLSLDPGPLGAIADKQKQKLCLAP